MARVAWVESPLQLLNALEYAYASGESVHVCLRADVPRLGTMGRALAPHLPRRVTMSGPWKSTMQSPFATARRRLVGDVSSAQVRAAITVTGATDVVLVDDGAAMLTTARTLAAGHAVVRHGRHESVLKHALGAVTTSRVLTAAAEARLTVFTAYNDAPELQALERQGARLRTNTYAWVRTTNFDHEPVEYPHIVVGSALVDDGFLQPEAYLEWLRRVAADGPVAYFPHRRERAESLQQWASVPGVQVRRSGLPVEIVVASAVGLRRISTLPSSVVATLSRLVSPHTRVDVTPVDSQWWTPRADQRLRVTLDAVVGRRSGVAAT